MILKYNKVDVYVDDPQGRFVDDKEFDVRLKYISALNKFDIIVPEVKEKEVDTTPKPQPTAVYDDNVAKVKGTITVKEHLKVGIDLAIEKALELGHDRLKDSLDNAFEATFEECKTRN